MTPWQELARTALMGTERQALPNPPPGLPEGDAEQTLLRTAAYLSLRRLAATAPLRQDQPSWPPCPPETLKLPPARATARLAALLDEEAWLVGEWMKVAGRTGCRIPSVLLPRLLDQAVAPGSSALKPLIEAALGERGRWLAGLNPAWSSLAVIADPDRAFEEGERAVRARALRQVRERDAAVGREMLAATWASETADMRATLLGCLRVRLEASDEDFLESALRDGTAAVRAAAQELLCELPGSRFAQRMRERALSHVKVQSAKAGRPTLGLATRSGLRVEVEPPQGCDSSMQADGIQARPPKGMGERAWLLRQVLALTPPSTWPTEAFAGMVKSDWAAALLEGIGQALELFPNLRWAELILLAAADPSQKLKLNIDPGRVVRALSPEQQETLLQSLMRRQPALAAETLLHVQGAWSPALSVLALRDLWPLTRSTEGLSRYLQVLHAARLQAQPAVIPELEKHLEGAEKKGLLSVLERLIHTLRQRAQIEEDFLEL